MKQKDLAQPIKTSPSNSLYRGNYDGIDWGSIPVMAIIAETDQDLACGRALDTLE